MLSRFRAVLGYEGKYVVDDCGNVWSLSGKSPHKLKPQLSTGGYLKVMLYHEKIRRWAYIHRLVAEAFLPKPDNYDVVNHIDANPQNCAVENLEWVNQAKNIEHSRKLGNQNKDIPVQIISPTGEVFKFGNMREASQKLFGGPLILRGQYRRKGRKFKYHNFTIEVMPNEVRTA